MNREMFFGLLKDKLSARDLKLIQNAYWFAKDAHRAQTRDDGERYFEHCRRVALVLIRERGIFDPEIIVTALTHDVGEDTTVPPDVIFSLFGPSVYEWTQLLSKTLPVFDATTGAVTLRGKKDLQKYFWAIQSGPIPAGLVKCADRTDNMRSFGCWPPERKAKYIRETREYIIPIAQKVDPWFVDELSKHCIPA